MLRTLFLCVCFLKFFVCFAENLTYSKYSLWASRELPGNAEFHTPLLTCKIRIRI